MTTDHDAEIARRGLVSTGIILLAFVAMLFYGDVMADVLLAWWAGVGR